MIYTTVDSPLGELLLVASPAGLAGLFMTPHRHATGVQPGWVRDPAPFHDVEQQLAEYFAGDRQEFTLDLDPVGTPFQQRVWTALATIPYGQTWSYSQLAQAVGAPGAARAVGLANGRNPISVVVPCHRVIGAGGKLTGYGGGLERKRLLLDLEAGRSPLPV